jgi:hypothetical protein
LATPQSRGLLLLKLQTSPIGPPLLDKKTIGRIVRKLRRAWLPKGFIINEAMREIKAVVGATWE